MRLCYDQYSDNDHQENVPFLSSNPKSVVRVVPDPNSCSGYLKNSPTDRWTYVVGTTIYII